MPERRLAVIARADALGEHAYTEKSLQYAKAIREAEAELDRREAEAA